MKKRMLLLSMACGLLAITASAQILKGDMNDDGVLDVIDLNATTATILGQQEKQFIKTGGDPFAIDNSPVAGYWYRSEYDKFVLIENGKTNYPGAATYEFHPYQGRIVFLNASGEPVSRISVINLKEGSMVCAINGQSPLVTYTAKQPTRVNSIQLDATHLEMKPNETHQLTATVLPADANYKAVTWSSSNENVAKVANGNVEVVGYGTATITCSATDGSGVKATCEVKVECEYVDLGLPGGVLWATCNVGAIKPEDAGKYFAWGDTVGYAKNEEHNFDWAHYKWCNGSEETLTKYYYTDHKEVLDTEDDAATASWGSEWRMPTSQELCDLIDSDYTTVVVEKVNGVKCCKITSKKNGNSILLPPSGVREDSYVLWDTHNGRYWSREKFISDSSYAYHLEFQIELTSNDCTSVVFRDGRYKGITIRPVRVSTK